MRIANALAVAIAMYAGSLPASGLEGAKRRCDSIRWVATPALTLQMERERFMAELAESIGDADEAARLAGLMRETCTYRPASPRFPVEGYRPRGNSLIRVSHEVPAGVSE